MTYRVALHVHQEHESILVPICGLMAPFQHPDGEECCD